MTTIADRILAISGQASGTVGALVAAFPGSSGDTIAERFTSYSGITTGTVAQHLNTEPQPVGAGIIGGGTVFIPTPDIAASDAAHVIAIFLAGFTATVTAPR